VRAFIDESARPDVGLCEEALDMMRRDLRLALLGALALLAGAPGAVRADQFYFQTNLVTSASDSDLINPWGISESGGSPFWVSDNHTGVSTLYNTAGVKQGLRVVMPTTAADVTGQVFNGTANFHGDTFLFATESGTINGWRGALGTNAEPVFTVANAVYKGLAISTDKSTLFAANFANGTVDTFDSTHTGPTGQFSDPTVPAGYAPFNIQNLGGKFFVTFALQDSAKHDDVGGVGHGIVDMFDPVSHTFTRLATGSAAGGTVTALNSPWGLALAPASFGAFGGDLLVGNFGDGRINAFDPNNGTFLGTLMNAATRGTLINPGLWGLQFGNGGNGGLQGVLYFTAGGGDEMSGVFGQLIVPEPGSVLLFGLGGAVLGVRALRLRRRARAA
jgi:uncharacterized protein (TIGR03118 family)